MTTQGRIEQEIKKSYEERKLKTVTLANNQGTMTITDLSIKVKP